MIFIYRKFEYICKCFITNLQVLKWGDEDYTWELLSLRSFLGFTPFVYSLFYHNFLYVQVNIYKSDEWIYQVADNVNVSIKPRISTKKKNGNK